MKITPTTLPEVVLVEPTPHGDARGSFARTYCAETFAAAGLETAVSQCSVSFNIRTGTLRGMHLQVAPHGEAKLVRCTAGAIFDVAVDVRRDSPTLGRWVGIRLDAETRRALFIPDGFAHGFLTLAPNTEVFYQISAPFVPAAARGFRWDDPAVGIMWPTEITAISEKDANLPRLAGMLAQR
jgi:dTDP-4-dehydrorhamnose 3,5-epimerase